MNDLTGILLLVSCFSQILFKIFRVCLKSRLKSLYFLTLYIHFLLRNRKFFTSFTKLIIDPSLGYSYSDIMTLVFWRFTLILSVHLIVTMRTTNLNIKAFLTVITQISVLPSGRSRNRIFWAVQAYAVETARPAWSIPATSKPCVTP
jgi:hypothetical protein